MSGFLDIIENMFKNPSVILMDVMHTSNDDNKTSIGILEKRESS
jgi:hypothetical protein